MTRAEFYQRIEALIDAPPGSLDGTAVLQEQENWDSLAIMSALALLHDEFGVTIPAERIYQSRTLGELADLAGPALAE